MSLTVGDVENSWNKTNFGKLDAPFKNTEPLVSTKRGTANKDKFNFVANEKPTELSRIKISRKHIHKIPKPSEE